MRPQAQGRHPATELEGLLGVPRTLGAAPAAGLRARRSGCAGAAVDAADAGAGVRPKRRSRFPTLYSDDRKHMNRIAIAVFCLLASLTVSAQQYDAQLSTL